MNQIWQVRSECGPSNLVVLGLTNLRICPDIRQEFMEEIQRILIELTFHTLLTFKFKMVYVITFLYVNNLTQIVLTVKYLCMYLCTQNKNI